MNSLLYSIVYTVFVIKRLSVFIIERKLKVSTVDIQIKQSGLRVYNSKVSAQTEFFYILKYSAIRFFESSFVHWMLDESLRIGS